MAIYENEENAMYEIAVDNLGSEIIKRTDLDGKVWWIPTDPANSDYKKYLGHFHNFLLM